MLPGSYKNKAVHQWLYERTRVTRGMSAIITVIISDEEAYWERYERNFKWPNYLYCVLYKRPGALSRLYVVYCTLATLKGSAKMFIILFYWDLLIFMCVHEYVCIHHSCSWCFWMPEEGISAPRLELQHGGCWEPISGPL